MHIVVERVHIYIVAQISTLMYNSLRWFVPQETDRLEGRPVIVGHDHDGRGGEAGT